ncbi:unnamed protein product [Ilex paraguariensis]|uniref:Uncharacterized protein n=1 Tax=Ilex paraguariensis TaxID=185542 RepID=A0ABC8UYF5_9AQUA
MAFMFLGAIFLFFIYFSNCGAELLTALPGQPTNVTFKQYSGYIVTNAQHGRALFYYFVEAESGPGCSPLGVGAFMENGPFQVGENGLLVRNYYSWNSGHYIPQLAALLLEHNQKPNIRSIKLKSIALGNPLLDLDISVLAGNYLWSHGAISDDTLSLENRVCNDSSGQIGMRKTKGDPCLPLRILTYLNKPQVQKALHANTTNLPYSWDFCGGEYQYDNFNINLLPLLSDLLKECIPISLYSGDQDSKIPLTQTRIIANHLANELKLSTFTEYRPWYDKKQVGGWSQPFGGMREGKNVTFLTYTTVRGAAHEVPFTSLSQALTLFRSFLNGSQLPRPHD